MGILDPLKIFARIAALVLVLTAAAHAQDAGDGGGADGGGYGGDGSSNDGSGGNPGDGADADGADTSATDPDSDGACETADAPSADFSASPEPHGGGLKQESVPAFLNQYVRGPDGALKAVQADRALPLDNIVTAARHLTTGQIIDARLKAVKGALQYELKVLETSGKVRRYSFDARTGQLAKVR